MPIYEYRCAACGAQVEVLVRSHTTTPSCPRCGSLLAEGKLFSRPYVLNSEPRRQPGHTCCGREERCDIPPCSSGGTCRRD
jgi:putative FmdB family regulatory protein